MQLESWVIPCVLFDWQFHPWKLWEIWLVGIFVLPMWLQNPSAPSVLSITTPLGTLCSVQWLAASIHLCICQTLTESHRRQIYQAHVTNFLASTIVSGFGDSISDGFQGGGGSHWMAFSSVSDPYYFSIFPPVSILLLLRRTEASTLWSSFFSLMWSVNCILVILNFWANIHLSVCAYHMCSFLTGLPHSGWYFLVPSICLWISCSHCF
jgi:hypothetical protein